MGKFIDQAWNNCTNQSSNDYTKDENNPLLWSVPLICKFGLLQSKLGIFNLIKLVDSNLAHYFLDIGFGCLIPDAKITANMI